MTSPIMGNGSTFAPQCVIFYPAMGPQRKPRRAPEHFYQTLKLMKRQPHASGRWVCFATAQTEPNASAADSSAAALPRLADLEPLPVVNVQGYINPEMPEGTQATVFAVYDQAKTLQYIGFSKNLRASLLTVFSRRPDKSHLYRALHLPQLDQNEMLSVRSSWFDQSGGPPPGNRLPAERAAWQEAATPFTISDRGKVAAAEELAKSMIVKIKSRGCKEEFLVNQDLIQEGKVDFLAVADLDPKELERQRREAEAAARMTRNCSVIVEGETLLFDIFFKSAMKTNGGYMFDLRLTAFDRETTHRVIVGKDYYERQGIDAEEVVERVFSYLLAKEVPRQTDGMLLSSEFPINYFSVSEVHQFFDDFEEFFQGEWLKKGDYHEFWRFNRTQDYGYKGENESVEALAAMFQPKLGNSQSDSDESDEE
ncbi:hypothetical protein Ndes2437B_g04120 [Nannochloris sp. 'desiccata']